MQWEKRVTVWKCHGFARPKLCCQSFGTTEAALSLALFACNLTQLFLRHFSGWREKVTVQTRRYGRWFCAGILSHLRGRTTLQLGLSPPLRSWWHQCIVTAQPLMTLMSAT